MQNSKKHIPIILGQPFLTISDAYIQCKVGNIQLSFAIMTTELNIFKIAKQPCDKNEKIVDVDFIRELVDHIFPSTICDDPLQICFAYIVLPTLFCILKFIDQLMRSMLYSIHHIDGYQQMEVKN